MESDIIELRGKIETDHIRRMREYEDHVSELEKQRKEFYEKNPDFTFTGMFLNVWAKPQKIEIVLL
jgi:hypothetical protein